MKKGIKKFFTEKPKGNIWKRIAIYLILLRYLGFGALILILPFMIGLASPGQKIDFHNASQNIAVVYENSMDSLYYSGSQIALNNPILSKVLLFLIGNIVWVFYAGIFILFIDMIGALSSWIYQKMYKKTGSVKDE